MIKETGFDEQGNIDRNSIDALIGEVITDTYIDSKMNVIFLGKDGQPIFMVKWKELFDPSGNRFNA